MYKNNLYNQAQGIYFSQDLKIIKFATFVLTKTFKYIATTVEFRGSHRFLSGIKGSGVWSNQMGL